MINCEISTFLQTRIDVNDFPSCVYLVAEKGEIIYQDALGVAVVEPEKIEAKIDTIYDLASLTKPIVTGLLCAKLIENREINLSDSISKFFPNFNAEITIQNLLTHSSGMIAWKPFYLISDSRFQIPNLIAEESITAKPNQSSIYSDLNFLTLTFLLEKLYGKRLDNIANDEIITPLGLHDTFFNPLKKLKERIAASEFGNKYEEQICIERGFADRIPHSAFRNYQIWGEVHDGNCYFMNGVSGHAGLFSTADETFKIAQQFLINQTQLLKPETCNLFRTNFTPNMNEARSIAFQLAATEKSTASESLAKDSFGHLGFAGTSLWIEPETERIFILLTNRTHAHEIPFVNINSVRRTFHEIAAEQLNGK
jgi:serine-type D-Ala-D-Ala carboxypeptidase